MSTTRNEAAKKEILQRVHNALTLSGAPASVEHAQARRSTVERGSAELRALLVDRLEDYKATVVETTEDELSARIAAVLHERDCSHVVYAPGLPTSLFADFTGNARPDNTSDDPRMLGEVDAVVTDSHVTCALTGTITLESGPQCGRRALSLVPDRHVVIVRDKTVVYGVPEMIARLNPDTPATMISGPSATSDIELVRVEGVHGPRDLIVFLVSSADPQP
ncbi:LutC/YkgG family protein [Corynebacterium mayonis]|uniref:LutC/YkgG family protein n=1 Tax=Corynebacterium mayonis TaxID=3062461 RepID=UPI003140A223